MNKTTIKNALKRTAGGAEFITQGDIKRSLHCGNDRAAEIVKGLEYFKIGRTKKYDVEEVASAIYAYVEQ